MIGHFRLEDIVDLIKHCPTRSLKSWDDQGLKTCTDSILKQTARAATICKAISTVRSLLLTQNFKLLIFVGVALIMSLLVLALLSGSNIEQTPTHRQDCV